MSASLLEAAAFYFSAALTVSGALVVACSKNIVRSAFALLGAFLGVAGLYVLLAADLMAVIQLLVYVGGVLVLILFAVMLTSRISAVEVSNPSLGLVGGLFALVAVCGPLLWVAPRFPVGTRTASVVPTTATIGNELLGPYVLPFEVISVLLVAALVGAVTLAKSPPRRPRRPPEPAPLAEARAPAGESAASKEPQGESAAAAAQDAEPESAAARAPASEPEAPARDTLESTADNGPVSQGAA